MGVYRTRVGYTGGQTASPTYRSMGDHTEALQVDFDPQQISLQQMVESFFTNHTPTNAPRSRQYMAAIWYADDNQKAVVQTAKDETEDRLSAPVLTPCLPLETFFNAEDYHQKYRLQRHSKLMKLFGDIYPDFQDFVNSTAAARLNGDGLAKAAKMSDEELMQYGILSDEVKRTVSRY